MRSSAEQKSTGAAADKGRPPLVASLVGAVPVTLLPGGVEVEGEDPTLPLVLPVPAARGEDERQGGAPAASAGR
jgi:hypothetical protein